VSGGVALRIQLALQIHYHRAARSKSHIPITLYRNVANSEIKERAEWGVYPTPGLGGPLWLRLALCREVTGVAPRSQ
jgi:hypothetical protein